MRCLEKVEKVEFAEKVLLLAPHRHEGSRDKCYLQVGMPACLPVGGAQVLVRCMGGAVVEWKKGAECLSTLDSM